MLAGTPWLDVFCPGCTTSRALDLRELVINLKTAKALGVSRKRCWPLPTR
jgi:hypothetical protein